MILLIDNYDSFVHTLARYFERLGQRTVVVRNDAIDVSQVRAMKPAAVVLSPGPCTPREAGVSVGLVRALQNELPILGVCLGHQAIAEALGGRVARAAEPRHGRTSLVHHRGDGLFAGLPTPLVAARYHSLIVEPDALPRDLQVTAWTDEGVVMAIEHRRRPLVGLQFHPESILTQHGYQLLAAFLRLAGQPVADVPTIADEHTPSVKPPRRLPEVPVTF